MANDPSTTITDQFPKAPYSWDQPPPGYVIGPLKAIFTKVGQAIQDYLSQVTTMQQMITVQTATGIYLDAHAKLYGVVRITNETDAAFRVRILGAIKTGKLTLSAIQQAVVNYYAATLPTNTQQPTVTVLDLQSNPTQATTDGLQILDFEINVAFAYRINEGFFLDLEAYLDNMYLAPYSGQENSLGTALDALLSNVKAAGTHPVYFVSSTWS